MNQIQRLWYGVVLASLFSLHAAASDTLDLQTPHGYFVNAFEGEPLEVLTIALKKKEGFPSFEIVKDTHLLPRAAKKVVVGDGGAIVPPRSDLRKPYTWVNADQVQVPQSKRAACFAFLCRQKPAVPRPVIPGGPSVFSGGVVVMPSPNDPSCLLIVDSAWPSKIPIVCSKLYRCRVDGNEYSLTGALQLCKFDISFSITHRKKVGEEQEYTCIEGWKRDFDWHKWEENCWCGGASKICPSADSCELLHSKTER